jgi:hypothetical protein
VTALLGTVDVYQRIRTWMREMSGADAASREPPPRFRYMSGEMAFDYFCVTARDAPRYEVRVRTRSGRELRAGSPERGVLDEGAYLDDNEVGFWVGGPLDDKRDPPWIVEARPPGSTEWLEFPHPRAQGPYAYAHKTEVKPGRVWERSTASSQP